MKADVLFHYILNMSVTASLTIVMVLAARILLRKSRRFWSFLLWVPVLFRLLCPFSLKSPVSAAALMPSETMTIPSGSGNISMVSYADLPGGASASAGVTLVQAASMIWIVGAAALLCYTILSEVRFIRKLPSAGQKNMVEDPRIPSPFLHGILKPVIYLPAGLNEKEKESALLHEHCHIRYGDPVFKLLFWLAVILHWFNPLVWIAFRLMNEDMEIRCDEYALQHSDVAQPAYAELLLRFAAENGAPADHERICFSMEHSRNRIIHVLQFARQSDKRVAAAGAVIAVLCTTACASNPSAVVPAGTADMSAYRGIGTGRNQFNEVDIYQLFDFFEEKGTGLIYIGRPDLEYCQETVPVLNQVAEDQGLTVLYLDDQKFIDSNSYDSHFMLNWYQLCDELGPAGDREKSMIVMPLTAWVEDGEVVRYEDINEDYYGKKLSASEKQAIYDSYRNLILES